MDKCTDKDALLKIITPEIRAAGIAAASGSATVPQIAQAPAPVPTSKVAPAAKEEVSSKPSDVKVLSANTKTLYIQKLVQCLTLVVSYMGALRPHTVSHLGNALMCLGHCLILHLCMGLLREVIVFIITST